MPSKIGKQSHSMVHLNGNILCAIDIETTGTNINKHEIIQIDILPLNHRLEPCQELVPLDINILPYNTDDISFDAVSVLKSKFEEILQTGIDQSDAADLLEDWFNNLGLAERKRIMPLGHNWLFDASFIKEWLGPITFEHIFDGRYRDTMTCSLFLNDRMNQTAEEIPFPKNGLRYICGKLGIIEPINSNTKGHDAMEDCELASKAYKIMMRI